MRNLYYIARKEQISKGTGRKAKAGSTKQWYPQGQGKRGHFQLASGTQHSWETQEGDESHFVFLTMKVTADFNSGCFGE